MTKQFNDTIEKTLGIRINRSTRIPTTTPNANPLLVEFIGVSGVGKTTFLNEYYKKKQSNINKSKIVQLLQIARYWDYSTINLPSKYDGLLKDNIKTITQTSYTGNTQYKLINKAVNAMKRDFIATHSFTDKLVIIDEGILHKTNEVLINYSLEALKPFIDNKLIVFCDATEEEITRRLISRKKDSKSVLNLDKNIYAQLVSKSKANLNQLFEMIQEANVPTIRLNLEDKLNKNLEKLESFIVE